MNTKVRPIFVLLLAVALMLCMGASIYRGAVGGPVGYGNFDTTQFSAPSGGTVQITNGALQTNIVVKESLIRTNSGNFTDSVNMGASGNYSKIYRRGGTKYFHERVESYGLLFEDNNDNDLLTIGVTGITNWVAVYAQNGITVAQAGTFENSLSVSGTISGSSAGNDIKTHERLQFVNRATTTVDNTASQTTLTNATASGYPQLSAAYLTEGTTITVEAAGTFANMEGSETVTFRAKLSSVIIGSQALSITSNGRWKLTMVITVRTTGAAGALVSDEIVHDAAGSFFQIGSTTSAVDTTAANVFDFTVQMSATGDTVTCDTLKATVLRP